MIAGTSSDTNARTPWPVVALGDEHCFAWDTGLWTGKKPPFIGIAVLRNTNFTDDGRIDCADVAAIEVERRHLPGKQLLPGDIILERSGGGPKQPVGRVAFFDIPNGTYSYSNFTARLRVLDTQRFDAHFVHLFLHHLHASGGTHTLQQNTTGIRNLRFGDYLATLVPSPPLSEQRAVVRLLSSIQNVADVEGRRVTALKELKAAMTARVFREGLRGEPLLQSEIGEIPQSWELAELGEVARVSTGTTPATENSAYYSGSTAFIKTAEIVNNHISRAAQHVSDEAVSRYNLRIYPPGTVLLAMYGQGKTRGQVSLLQIEAATTQNTAAIEPGPRIRSAYLWHYLLGQYRNLRSGGNLGHLSHLNLGYVSKWLIPVPSLSEQGEIEAVLNGIHRRTRIAEDRQRALLGLFSATLDQIMTGQLRVTSLLEYKPNAHA